jgi:hypothetical protein
MSARQTMKETIATNSVEDPVTRVIRAFGQEAHVLVRAEQTGNAFCVLRIFRIARQCYAAALA